RMYRLYESKSLTAAYKKYRPTHPPELARFVVNKMRSKNKTDSSEKVDVGCGSGQATNIFAPYFKKVLATDPSVNQLEHARMQNKFDNVSYEEGTAENIKVEDCSLDLLVAGCALPYFDHPKFLQEADRVLKPGGYMALYGLQVPVLLQPDEVESIGTSIFKSYSKLCLDEFPDIQHLVVFWNTKYQTIFDAIKYEDKERKESFSLVKNSTMEDFLGFFRSTHAYEMYMKKQAVGLNNLSDKEQMEKLKQLDVAEHCADEVLSRCYYCSCATKPD
uniref:Methyltransferase type 11 domain-containing protein n=1 Tax=Ciona intestinalis TaxID=7719 RepID=F6RBS2_CIOIN